MRIIAVVAIIAEDKILVLRDFHSRQRVTWLVVDIFNLVQGSAIDGDFSIYNLNNIAGQANNAFDERVFGLKGRIKDYYISV